MTDKRDLTMDESIASGWLRTTLSGDTEAAKGYLPQARGLLGRMKTYHGVNERIAAGEPGGYFSVTRVLPDGTQLQAFTNDGHDTVKITVPTREDATLSESTPDFPHTEHAPAFPELALPEPALPTETTDKKPPRVTGYQPFLWIGARIVKGRQRNQDEKKLHVCVWEPPPTPKPGEEPPDPIILSNRNTFTGYVIDPDLLHNLVPDSVYPLGYWRQFMPEKEIYTGLAYTDQKLFMVLPDNYYEIPMRVPDYDPAVDEDVKWDVMFISDPDNDLNLVEGDIRMEGSDLGGEYLVKVMLVGEDCQPRSEAEPVEVELSVYVGKNEDRIISSTRFTLNAWTEYRMGMMPKGYFDGPYTHGTDSCSTCSDAPDDYGDNPHGPHWWPGAATIFVPPRQYEIPPDDLMAGIITFSKEGEIVLPPTGFIPGGFPSRFELCGDCGYTKTEFSLDGFNTLVVSDNKTIGDDVSGSVYTSEVYYTHTSSSADAQIYTVYGLPTSTSYTGRETGQTISRDIGDSSYQELARGPFNLIATYDQNGFRYVGIGAYLAEYNFDAYWAVVNSQTGYHAGDDYVAFYKYSTTYAPDGTITGRSASYISKGEYDARPSSGHVDVCTRVEKP